MKGKFFAVSTGPAGSDYLTLGAVNILKSCSTIFYPITGHNVEKNVAFDCVKSAIDVSNKKCVGVHFSMTRDFQKTNNEYETFASEVIKELENGDVAFISIGDVSIYSTAARIANIVKENGFEIRFIAGVTSFCAAACECCLDIASDNDDDIRIIAGDACYLKGKLYDVLSEKGAKIFMKSARYLKDIIEEIKKLGLCEKSYLIQGVGYENQRIFSGDELINLENSVFDNAYMSVLLVESV